MLDGSEPWRQQAWSQISSCLPTRYGVNPHANQIHPVKTTAVHVERGSPLGAPQP